MLGLSLPLQSARIVEPVRIAVASWIGVVPTARSIGLAARAAGPTRTAGPARTAGATGPARTAGATGPTRTARTARTAGAARTAGPAGPARTARATGATGPTRSVGTADARCRSCADGYFGLTDESCDTFGVNLTVVGMAFRLRGAKCRDLGVNPSCVSCSLADRHLRRCEHGGGEQRDY